MVFNIGSTEHDFTARIVRAWNAAHDLKSYGVEQFRIDPIVDEWRFQCDLASAVAQWRRKGGEIAGEHCGTGNELALIFCILPEGCTLKTAEEKQPVLYDRAARGAAELIALQRTARGWEVW